MNQATKRSCPCETCCDKDEIENDQLPENHPDHLDNDDDDDDDDPITAHFKYLKERIRTLASTTELPTDYWTDSISIHAFEGSAVVKSPTPTASPPRFPQPNYATSFSRPSTPIAPLDQSPAAIQRKISADMPPPPRPNPSAAVTPTNPENPASLRATSRTPSYASASLVRTTGHVNSQAQNDPITTMLSHETGSCIGDCSSQSCDGGCSMDFCPPGCVPTCEVPSCEIRSCDGSQICDALDPCTSFECTDSPTCLDNSCPWTSFAFGHAPAFGNDFSNQIADTGANDPMQCLWLMPDQQCDVSVPTMESLGQHVLHDHIEPQGTFTCPIDQCAEKLDMYQAPSHLMLEHDPDSYVCLWRNCGQTFPDSKELDRHIKADHAIWDCHWAGCEVSAREVSQLKNHVDMDHLHFSGLSRPPRSPSALPTPMYAGEHPALHISTQSPFATPQLSPANPVLKPFVQGSMVSGDKNPFGMSEGGSRCMWLTDESRGQVCGKTFSDGNELQLHVDQEHVWTREGNTTGIVLLCHWLDCKRDRKPLQNKEKLRRHLFTHTGYWIACCSFCSKQFNNTVALDNHERVHTGEKPFACKDCEQCFATDAALTIHKRHHTGEKPLSCPVCGYASADSSNMAKHKKTHEPHEHFCLVCNRGFSRSGTLERHMRVHDPNRPLRRKRARSEISS